MSLFDKLSSAVKNFDYEGAANSLANSLEKKQAEIEKNARSKIRQKARNASDEALRRNLDKAIDEGNYIMEDEIKREMDRRGLYY